MAKQTSQEVSGWVGWVYFAGLMMTLLGAFQAIAGLVALFKDEVYVATQQNIWILDYTQWGWIHLLAGFLVFFAGVAVMGGKTWGRVIGVLLAGAAAIANFAFVPIYPFWSILMVVVYILVIYALIVHGGDARIEE